MVTILYNVTIDLLSYILDIVTIYNDYELVNIDDMTEKPSNFKCNYFITSTKKLVSIRVNVIDYFTSDTQILVIPDSYCYDCYYPTFFANYKLHILSTVNNTRYNLKYAGKIRNNLNHTIQTFIPPPIIIGKYDPEFLKEYYKIKSGNKILVVALDDMYPCWTGRAIGYTTGHTQRELLENFDYIRDTLLGIGYELFISLHPIVQTSKAKIQSRYNKLYDLNKHEIAHHKCFDDIYNMYEHIRTSGLSIKQDHKNDFHSIANITLISSITSVRAIIMMKKFACSMLTTTRQGCDIIDKLDKIEDRKYHKNPTITIEDIINKSGSELKRILIDVETDAKTYCSDPANSLFDDISKSEYQERLREIMEAFIK